MRSFDLNMKQELDLQMERYTFLYPFSFTIAAGARVTHNLPISNDAHFWVDFITGSFTTLTGAAADGGACQISMSINDNGVKPLTNDLVPLDLFFSPGRVRSSGVAGDPSNSLFFPIDFGYGFMANSVIALEFSSAANYANVVRGCFHGVKYKVRNVQ